MLPGSLKDKFQKTVDDKTITEWEKSGRTLPPPHIVKVKTVEHFQKKTQYSILIESGTFMGDMIQSQLDNFDKIYSIELSEKYWESAKIMFSDQPKVNLLLGDSGEVLHSLISEISEPAIFWLDGHYSGADTARGEKISPIYEELKAIFKSNISHCILIDDARLFNGTDDYPALENLKKFIVERRPEAKLEVDADTISVIY
ncbi:MAG: hypothetical protein ACJAV5_000966 [Vicingaceae bacterium]|jgi:hypothetical protein